MRQPPRNLTRKSAAWDLRNDPFSTYRAGFEIRTYRLCQRVLMFHHFPDEPGVGANCLVRSTDFTYSYEADPASAQNPIFSFLLSVSQSGYTRDARDGYLQKSLPALEFEYSQATISAAVQEVDAASLENLPIGLDGASYQWVDLDGEGLSGILTEHAGALYYKRNLSPALRAERPGSRVLHRHVRTAGAGRTAAVAPGLERRPAAMARSRWRWATRPRRIRRSRARIL